MRGHRAPQVQSGFLANRPLPADHVRCYVQDLAGGVPVSGLEPKDQLIRFEKDGGHHLYVYQYEEGDAEAKIFRLETATGR